MDLYYAGAKGQEASQRCICFGFRRFLHPLADWVCLQTRGAPASKLVEGARIWLFCLYGVILRILSLDK